MKKLSTQAPLIREAEEKNLAIQQENWREYFGAKLSKFDAKSLADMSEEKKSEFFNDLNKDWDRSQKITVKMNEAKVKTDAEFKEYAETVLKKAFGEEYDQKKADETINGILKKVGGDYGAAIGMLTSGLSESKFVKEDGYEEFAEIDENLSLSNLGVEGDVLYVMINGNKYGYKAPAGKDIEDLAKSFAGLAKHSAGKALAWIKKNAELVFGSKKVQESVNEGEEIFISDERFQDLGSLKADILKNMTPAINDFLARQGIKYNPITVKEDRGRYTFISKPVTGKDLGFFQYGMVEAYIDSFGGGQVPRIREADGKIEFNPLIWFNLHYSYKHGTPDTGSQGSNGCALYPPGEDRSVICYNISTGRFLTSSEAEKTKF